MARRLKVTGFTRFFLFLIIVAPTIFFGVTYYRGVDGIQLVKDMLNGDFSGDRIEQVQQERTEDTQELPPPPPPLKTDTQVNEDLVKLQEELDFKNNRIEELYEENAGLKEELGAKEKELETVKEQLDSIKKAIGGDQ